MTTPYKFQLEGLEVIEKFGGRCLIADDMGMGKTLSALLYVQKHPELRPVIVICPAYLKWNWEKEAITHINMRAEILEGRNPSKGEIRFPAQLIVVNYEILEAWLPQLKLFKSPLIIIDETQYIAHRSKRTRATKELCKKSPHILGLSGTPITSRPSEIWNIIHILRPDVFKVFYSAADPNSFARRFCRARINQWGAIDARGAANLDVLNKLLTKTVMLRRRKQDVLDQLPPKSRFIVPLDLENKREYQEAATDFRGWLKKNVPKKFKKSMRAEAVTQMGYLKRLAATLKMKGVMEWIDNFLKESDEKLILFMVHKSIVNRLEIKYEKICSTVTGKVIGRNRELAFSKFLKDRKTRLFIGNIRAAGPGWSAPGVSTVAFCELGWTPGEHIQAEDRCYGIGRGEANKPCSVYYLLGKNTIEEKLWELIQRKAKILNKVLDDGEGEDFDIVSELMEFMRK